MKKWLYLMVSGLLLLALPAFADKATDYVHRVDANMNPGKDMVSISKITIISSGGSTEVRKMKMYRKGEKKLFFFISPPGVKGVAFLSLSDDKQYLYMPAFKKVRRIASSAKGNDFMGTDMAYEDMATTDFTKNYTPKLISENDKEAHIVLTAKNDKAAYSKIDAIIDKTKWLRKSSKVYDKNGKLLKVMKMTNVKKIDGFWIPTHIEIENVQTHHKTIVDTLDVHINVGLKDSLFSKRKLSRIR